VSSSTWTPRAVASEAIPFAEKAWRAVEAQHVTSTLALVDSLDEQALLEELIESSKPKLPDDTAGLHYLLATPFRYPPVTHGSRFRSPADPGVFYAAREIRTACAELGYWRWRFLQDSPSLSAITSKPQTVFQAAIDADAVDLRESPFLKHRKAWTHPTDYERCQAFAVAAREALIGAILYASVRDPKHGQCVAVLTPHAFSRKTPVASQNWLLTVNRSRVYWQRQSVHETEAFEFAPDSKAKGSLFWWR
jgi:RES domain